MHKMYKCTNDKTYTITEAENQATGGACACDGGEKVDKGEEEKEREREVSVLLVDNAREVKFRRYRVSPKDQEIASRGRGVGTQSQREDNS